MKIAELKSKSVEELKGLVADMKKERFNLRMQKAAGEAGSQGRPRIVRKTIAQALTLINQKKGK